MGVEYKVQVKGMFDLNTLCAMKVDVYEWLAGFERTNGSGYNPISNLVQNQSTKLIVTSLYCTATALQQSQV